jgi:hypothetical protein
VEGKEEGEGIVSERRNTRESGEKDDWEAVIRGDSREETRERDGWAHRGTLSLQETIPSRGLPFNCLSRLRRNRRQ